MLVRWPNTLHLIVWKPSAYGGWDSGIHRSRPVAQEALGKQLGSIPDESQTLTNVWQLQNMFWLWPVMSASFQ